MYISLDDPAPLPFSDRCINAPSAYVPREIKILEQRLICKVIDTNVIGGATPEGKKERACRTGKSSTVSYPSSLHLSISLLVSRFRRGEVTVCNVGAAAAPAAAAHRPSPRVSLSLSSSELHNPRRTET